MTNNANHPTTCEGCTPTYGNYVAFRHRLGLSAKPYPEWLSSGMPGPHNHPHFIER